MENYIATSILVYVAIGLLFAVITFRNKKIDAVYKERISILAQDRIGKLLFVSSNWIVFLGILAGKTKWEKFLWGSGTKPHNNF